MFTETLTRVVTQGIYINHQPVKMIPSIDFGKKVTFLENLIHVMNV